MAVVRPASLRSSFRGMSHPFPSVIPRATVVLRPVCLALMGAVVGCGEPAAKTAARATPQATVDSSLSTTASATATPPCLLEGDWTPCAVEDRLVHAGVVIERQPEPARHPFLHVDGTVYHVGSPDHELQVFLYPSATERKRDTDALDSATASPRGARSSWKTPPTLVTSNNLAAVILSLNDRTVERLALALGAGLPQPEKR